IYRSPELPAQELVLRASAAAGLARVAFAIDGVPLGETSAADAWLAWGLAPGSHTLRVSALLPDGSTATAAARFEVK
ncbi:MAG: hypothetical protein M3R54_07170, partial [Chloroflexota bacterium]|nr:hypothetical protein [Chloroflexota bacterium]